MDDTTENSFDKKHTVRDLMLQYESDVWNFAFSLIKRQDLADDISQDVFVKVYQNLNSYRGQSSIKTWLFSITRNVAIDYRRSSFLRKVTLVNQFFDRGIHPSAEKEVLENMVAEDIWKIVLRLPTKLREVMVLHAHHHLSITEIAAVLDLTEAAVKTRLHRARNKVSSFLREDGEFLNGNIRV